MAESKHMAGEAVKSKLRSIILMLEAHPDNEPNSEFEDRISDLKKIIRFFDVPTEEDVHRDVFDKIGMFQQFPENNDGGTELNENYESNIDSFWIGVNYKLGII